MAALDALPTVLSGCSRHLVMSPLSKIEMALSGSLIIGLLEVPGAMGSISMSQRDLSRIEVPARGANGRGEATVAGRLMGLSRRQVFRLKARFAADRAIGVVNKRPCIVGCTPAKKILPLCQGSWSTIDAQSQAR